MVIGNREFDTDGKCHIMGILNVTPDSFSDGGKWYNIDAALNHAEEMINGGADIIDIGGESTRPGYTKISDNEEIERTIPIIEELSKRFDTVLSIDTYKSAVAKAALKAGASLINDIWGFRYDSDVASVVAESGAACCLMHNRREINYTNFDTDFLQDLKECVSIAKAAGIDENRIILDPGIGFAKTVEMNLAAINKINIIKQIGYPVLLGVSRKSFIRKILNLSVTDRLEASLAAGVIGYARGCSFLRVHDVKETKRAITIAESILMN